MKLNRCLLFLLLFFSISVFSQKNAPVAGDAAHLIDLLKKDYNTIDLSLRGEELMKDRAAVITIFKGYLSDQERDSLSLKSKLDHNLPAKIKNLESKQTEVLNAEMALAKLDKAKVDPSVKIAELNTAGRNLEKARFLVDSLDLVHLKTAYKDNAFIDTILSEFISKYSSLSAGGMDAFAASDKEGAIQKGLGFSGGDFGVEFAIALSKFLAERIKEELTVSVIEKVQDWLRNPSENDPLAELKVLMPRTNAYLLNFRASQVTNFPDEIKQYIEDDFNHILDNLGGLRNTPRLKALIGQYPDVDFALEALEMIPTLSKIKNPADFFDVLESSRNLERWAADTLNMAKCNIANTISFSSMLAHSLTVVDNGELRFAGSEFISSYASDINFYLLYAGFLRQQNKKYYDVRFVLKPEVKGKEKDSLVQYRLSLGLDLLVNLNVKEHHAAIKQQKEFFETNFILIGKHAEMVYNTSLDIRKANKKGEKIGADTLYSFVKSMIDLAEEITITTDTLLSYLLEVTHTASERVVKLPKDYELKKDLDLDGVVKPYFTLAHKTNEIVLDLQQENYAVALIKTLEVAVEVLPKKLTDAPKQLESIISLLEEFNAEHFIKWDADKWKALRKFFSESAPEGIDSKAKEAVDYVINELGHIKADYILSGGTDTSTINNLNSLIQEIKQLPVSYSKDQHKKIVFHLKDPQIQELIVSYYMKMHLDVVKTALLKKMAAVEVKVKGGAVQIFDAADIAIVSRNFDNLSKAGFKYLTGEIDKKELKNVQQELVDTLRMLLSRIPDKFSGNIDENTLKLIHFINEMALAKDAEDMEKAIESFALPVGSYSIKRESKHNISLNCYPGFLVGGEVTWKNNTAYGSFSPSFTAPVGISFSNGTKRGFSHGLFISLIDVGALTRMHFTKSDIEKDSSTVSTFPEFKFENLLAPGIYYSVGLKKTPLSLNFGLQYGPGLKTIDAAGNKEVFESMRFGVGIVLDIPLVNIHTKPRFER